MTPRPRAAIIGAGYAGLGLARLLQERARLVVTTGSTTRNRALRDAGLDARRWNLDNRDPAPLDPVEITGAVLHYHVPPAPNSTGDVRIARALATLPGPPQRIVYLSTTGVYGDVGGARVDEDTPPAPQLARDRRRLAAESSLRAWCQTRGVEWTILRVPGIYGPGRLPIERLRRGDPVLLESEAGPGNRIHVDDLVTACVLAGEHPAAANRIFNVGDGNGASSTQYLTRLAALLGLPAPQQLPRTEVQRRVSAEAWSFLGSSRRVDTSRICRELGLVPRYASLDDGLRASLMEESGDRPWVLSGRELEHGCGDDRTRRRFDREAAAIQPRQRD